VSTSPNQFDPTDVVQARRAVADASTSGADLQAIAAALPSLWPEVAAHPNAYPALLDWLDQKGDPAVAAALAARREAPTPVPTAAAPSAPPSPLGQASSAASQQRSPGAPTARRGSSRGLVALAVVLAVLLVGVGTTLVLLIRHPGLAPVAPASTGAPASRGGSAASGRTTAAATSVTTHANVLDTDPAVDGTVPPLLVPLLQQLPTARVVVDPGNSSKDVSTIQVYADDVADGLVDHLVAQCWTQPPEEVRLVYGSTTLRGAILEALRRPAEAAQYGVIWRWSTVTVSASWEELGSAYPCPAITWDTAGATPGLGSFTPAMARSHMLRALAIHDGKPLHKDDGTAYTVICSDDCAATWNPHSTGGPTTGRTAPIRTATADQWEGLRALSTARIVVEHLISGYYRVRAIDGSVSTVAYFVDQTNDHCLAYELGEIV